MNVTITTPTNTALPMVDGAVKQMPFAVARALTWVAEDVKFAMAREFGQAFTVRTPWVASPQRWVVTNARKEDYPRAQSRVDLDHRAPFLADFQTGKVRVPGDRAYDRVASLLNTIYMPTKSLRPTFAARVPLAMTPKAIGISLRLDADWSKPYLAGRGKHSRKTAKAAAARFFQTKAGIWERMGPSTGTTRGHDNIRFIWKALPSVRIPKRLHTLEWASAEVMKQWPDKMRRSFDLAIATARP